MQKPIKSKKISWIEITAIVISILGLLVIIIFSIAFTKGQHINIKDNITDPERFSSLGSFLGGITGPLLSFSGVLLVYSALVHQRKELVISQESLSSQMKELELQREELIETRKVYQEQSETMSQQRFETTFFNLIDTFDKIREKNFSSLEQLYNYRLGEIDFNLPEREIEEIINNNAFRPIYQQFERYFQFTEMILHHILDSKGQNGDYYAHILYTMLSRWEKTTLFYYGLSSYGQNMKIYFEAFNFFGLNFDESIIFHASHKLKYQHLGIDVMS